MSRNATDEKNVLAQDERWIEDAQAETWTRPITDKLRLGIQKTITEDGISDVYQWYVEIGSTHFYPDQMRHLDQGSVVDAAEKWLHELLGSLVDSIQRSDAPKTRTVGAEQELGAVSTESVGWPFRVRYQEGWSAQARMWPSGEVEPLPGKVSEVIGVSFWTGLRDCENNPIFGQDIVAGYGDIGLGIVNYDPDRAGYVVTYKDRSARLVAPYAESCKVVGNMYDDANLID